MPYLPERKYDWVLVMSGSTYTALGQGAKVLGSDQSSASEGNESTLR